MLPRQFDLLVYDIEKIHGEAEIDRPDCGWSAPGARYLLLNKVLIASPKIQKLRVVWVFN